LLAEAGRTAPATRRLIGDEFAELMRLLHSCGGPALPWADVDLTLPQLKLLGLLARRPDGVTGRELASALGVGPPAVTALVERIVEPGYARRDEDSHDRRVSRVRLTERGRALLERLLAGRQEQLAAVLQQLQPDELESVLRAVNLLRGAAARVAGDQASV
jgi:DNA-binding MarR family transcriptional regulator